ncbi:hypothetical protein AA0119_g8673 [Alternaria tenuissima]|nr:hypothetical protein AA0119_g8673 [Alternaria tenuissima]
MAQQAWMMESQAIIENTKSIWKSFVTGDLTLSAAGWLTNMAQHFVRCTDYPMDLTFSKALFCDYETGGALRSGVTLEELRISDFGKIATDSSFVELTHGCGMNWPFALLQPFLKTRQRPNLPEERPRRFETYFRSASKERGAKESFVQSVTDWVACNPSEPIVGDISDDVPLSDARKEVATICENHYSHDRILLTSLVKSASRHPLYEADEPQPPPGRLDDWASFVFSRHIQRILAVPLLSELKRKDVNTATIVTAHMLLESGRSFVHEFEKIGKPPLNCRIIVLRRANEVLNAINDLNRGRIFQVITVKYLETLTDKLHVFISDKTFDLYSQSPWVAGSQMSGMSDLSLFIGLEILREGDCLGAVVHLYNMLQQILNDYAEIPILEHLRTLFRSNVFACNQEPRRTFGNTFELFGGGAKTYKVPTVDINIIMQDKRRKASRREEEIFSKFSLVRTSLAAHESLFNAYALRPEFMEDRLGVDRKVLRRCLKTRLEDLFDNYPPSDLVQRAREVLRSEYDGTLALAQLNCFAVLRLCHDILLGIVARFKALGTAAWPPEVYENGLWAIEEVNIQNAIFCLCITMRLVDVKWDDIYQEDKFSSKNHKQIKDYIEGLTPVAIMRDVIAEECEGKNVEDFLWRNV